MYFVNVKVHSAELSKSTKIYFSLKSFNHRRPFLLLIFFNLWSSLFSKIMPNSQNTIVSFEHGNFWPKVYLFLYPSLEYLTTLITMNISASIYAINNQAHYSIMSNLVQFFLESDINFECFMISTKMIVLTAKRQEWMYKLLKSDSKSFGLYFQFLNL